MSVRIIIESETKGGKTSIAREFADRLRMFGMNVVVYDNDIHEPVDQPYPEVDSVEHMKKMLGIAQASEDIPVEIVTRNRLREVDEVDKVYVLNSIRDLPQFFDEWLDRAC
jgi:hypothetical protein